MSLNNKKLIFFCVLTLSLPVLVMAANEVTVSTGTIFTLNTFDTATPTTLMVSTGGTVTYLDVEGNFIDITLDSGSSLGLSTTVPGQFLNVTKFSGSNDYTISPTCPTTTVNLAGTGATTILRVKVLTTNNCTTGGGSGGGGSGGGSGRTPICTDGIQNGTETGIDCGGSCSFACAVPPPLVTPVPTTPEQIIGSGVCPAQLIITDNMKRGARDGRYNTYNRKIVTQVALLQTHVNRILAAQYNQASGPIDGIFGPLTKRGVQRLQTALNIIVKPVPPLVIDGIVGPFTKAAINNSCGEINLFTQ